MSGLIFFNNDVASCFFLFLFLKFIFPIECIFNFALPPIIETFFPSMSLLVNEITSISSKRFSIPSVKSLEEQILTNKNDIFKKLEEINE